MVFVSVLIMAFMASGLLSAPSVNALDVSNMVKCATGFAFNLFSSPKLQDKTLTKPPSELDYTTGGGVL
jgi:hypothetical protein